MTKRLLGTWIRRPLGMSHVWTGCFWGEALYSDEKKSGKRFDLPVDPCRSTSDGGRSMGMND